MDWKEFLKPDKMKILLTILLIVLLVSSFIFIPMLIPQITLLLFILLAPTITLLLHLYSGEGSILGYTVEPTLVLLFLIIEAIYLYLLSCFIIWIYNKVKKKK